MEMRRGIELSVASSMMSLCEGFSAEWCIIEN